jgi:hypothetical protein
MISDCRPQQAARGARARRVGQKAVGGWRCSWEVCSRLQRLPWTCDGYARGPWPTRRTFPLPQSITLGRSLFGSILGGHGRERGVVSRINARVECGRRGGRRWPRRAAATRWVGEQANRRLQSMGKRTGPCLSWDARCAAVVANWRARTSDVSRAHAPTMAPLPRDGRRMDESLIARGAPESQSGSRSMLHERSRVRFVLYVHVRLSFRPK